MTFQGTGGAVIQTHEPAGWAEAAGLEHGLNTSCTLRPSAHFVRFAHLKQKKTTLPG